MGVIFVILSAISFGISNAYWKKAIAKKPIYVVIFMRGLFASGLFGLILVLNYFFSFVPIVLFPKSVVPITTYIYAILLSIFSGFGLYFFVKSIQTGRVSIVAPLSSINIFSILTAVFILHENWKNEYIIQIILVITGSLFIYNASAVNSKKSISINIILNSVLAAFFWGISYALFKVTIQKIGALPFAFILELTITCFAFCIVIYNQVLFEIVKGNKIKDYIILSSLLFCGTFFINIGLLSVPIIIVNILSNITLLVSLVLGYIIYNEQLSLKEWIGVSFILMGILTTAFL
jgi:drug/metabolite transporter (DMT)-like permease